jgi:hypothetical protein
MKISICRDGTEIGEWTEEEIRTFHKEGRLVDTDLYWTEGMSEWLPLAGFIRPPPAFPVTIHASQHETLPPLPVLPPPLVVQPIPIPTIDFSTPSAATEESVKSQPALKPRFRDLLLPGLFALLCGYGFVYYDYRMGDPEPIRDFGMLTASALGRALVLFIIPALVCLRAKPSNRLKTCLIGIVIMAFISWLGDSHSDSPERHYTQETHAVTQSLKDEAAKQLATSGTYNPDSDKNEATLARLKSETAKMDTKESRATNAFLAVMSALVKKQKAFASAEDEVAPLLQQTPDQITSVDDIDARLKGLNKVHATVSDMLMFLKDFDNQCRLALAGQNLSDEEMNDAVSGCHKSGKIDDLVVFWQVNSDLTDEYVSMFGILKDQWGKWTVTDGKFTFQDSSVLETFNATVRDIQNDAQKQGELQKALLK